MQKLNSNQVKILEQHQEYSFLLQCVLIMPKCKLKINLISLIIQMYIKKNKNKILQ